MPEDLNKMAASDAVLYKGIERRSKASAKARRDAAKPPKKQKARKTKAPVIVDPVPVITDETLDDATVITEDTLYDNTGLDA